MEKITNICVEIVAMVCPKLSEEESVKIQNLLSEIMNEAKILDEKANDK